MEYEYEGYKPPETSAERKERFQHGCAKSVLEFMFGVGGIVLIFPGNHPVIRVGGALFAIAMLWDLSRHFVDRHFSCTTCGKLVGSFAHGLPHACPRCGASHYMTGKARITTAPESSSASTPPTTHQDAEQPPPAGVSDLAARLRSLEELRGRSAITEEEYREKRQKLLKEL